MQRGLWRSLPDSAELNRCTTRSIVFVDMAATFAMAQALTDKPSSETGQKTGWPPGCRSSVREIWAYEQGFAVDILRAFGLSIGQ